SCAVALLNAAAASLALGDKEAARHFFQQVGDDPRAYNNQGVLLLMEGDKEGAASYFRKYLPLNPRVARENLRMISE
ncbi:tetratricopeptide repeat protein, partial [Parabacteroides goldsteinii]